MAPPPPFAVEQWMDEYETKCKFNLAETCAASISINELCELSEDKDTKPSDLIDTSAIQTYGEIRGSTPLRENLSRLYSSKTGTPLSPENILITPGAIAANHLVAYALLKPGDHVVCQYPTYQSLYSIPQSLGAEVDFWKCKPENDWIPDFAELEALIRPTTKLLILNNPQNPTGAILPKPLLQKIISLAESHPNDLVIHSDEVYRPLFHSISPISPAFPPSILSLGYRNTIATGSLSKAYSLAGIRVGWIATRSAELVEKAASARDYTTISVSRLDQAVASHALAPSTVHALLGRNIALAKTNLELLSRWVVKHDEFCSWTPPVAGTTAFVKFSLDGKPVDAVEFCKRLMEKTGVMFLPGDRGFGDEWKGYVRIGFVNRTEVVKEGLEEARKFMRRDFEEVPLAE
ncbi:hypothetical protein MBLNU230_g8498t1 [Neophaeotheca triangularis]